MPSFHIPFAAFIHRSVGSLKVENSFVLVLASEFVIHFCCRFLEEMLKLCCCLGAIQIALVMAPFYILILEALGK